MFDRILNKPLQRSPFEGVLIVKQEIEKTVLQSIIQIESIFQPYL